MNIRLKLLVIFFFISIAPLIIISGVYLKQSTYYLTEEVLKDLEVMASVQKSRTKTVYERNIERLRLISSRTQLRLSLKKLSEGVTDQRIIQQKINQIILDAQNAIEPIKRINIYSLEGVIIASTQLSIIGEQHSDNKVFLNGLKAAKANRYSHDIDGTLIAHFSGPIYQENQIVGVLELESSFADLMSAIKDYTSLGETGETILAYKNDQGDAVFLNQSRLIANTGLKQTIKKTQLNMPITHALNGKNKTFVDFVDFNNTPVYAVTRFIDNAEWGLVVKINKREVFAKLTKIKYTFLIILGIFSVLFIVGILLISKHIIAPITKLTLAVEKIIKGNLAVNVDEAANDEIGNLTKAFNLMIKSLAEQKTTETKLLRSNSQFKTMFEEAPLGIAIIDSLSGSIYEVNLKFAEIAGRSREAMETIDWMSITHPDDVQEDLDNMARLNAGEFNNFTMQKRYQHPDGEYVWINMTVAKMSVEDISKPRHLCMVQDINKQKQLETEIHSSMQHLKLYREQTPLAAIEWNTDFQVIDWNDAAEKMFGYPLKEVQGRDFADIMLPKGAVVDVKNVWKDLMAQSGGTVSINENLTKSGHVILCEWHNSALVNDSGKVIGGASLVLDITRERAALQTLEKKELEQREVLNSLNEAVLTLTESGKILSYNQTAQVVFGLSNSEMLEKNFSLLIAESSEAHNSDLLIGTREAKGLHKNKGSFPMQVTVTELPLLAEGERRFIAACQDLTQLKSQQAQLQRAQKMDALGKLVGGVAHDYNNMLGVILGYTDLMEIKYSKVEGLQKYIDNIVQAGKRGQSLTKRLLSFSKQESTEAQAVSIHSILKAQQELFSKSVTALIKINYQLCDSEWMVWLDPSELEDALLNLTINAQHAMQNGGELSFSTAAVNLSKAEAQLLGLAENDYFKLSISDTGSGIDKAIINKVFDPFFSTKGTKGTGLGLSQVYGFMERAGGTVRLYSQKGHGSEFVLYFPRYKSEIAHQIKQVTKKITQGGNGETILVVDDEPALRELAEEILSMSGYRVLTANDGDSAIELLKANTVDAVLSDVIMPNMDGYQLAAYMQQHYPKVKIQLASGFSGGRHRQTKNEVLHKALLHKPYNSTELLENIAKLFKE